MGYFDGITDGLFKTDDRGRMLFYPWGILGKGYVLPDAMAKQKIHNFVKRQYMILLPTIIGVGVFVGWIWAFASLPVYCFWYLFAILRITKGLQVARMKLRLSESLSNSAKSHNIILLWCMFIFSILFVLASTAILIGLITSSDGHLVGLLGVMFFGICSIAFGYMIRNRKSVR